MLDVLTVEKRGIYDNNPPDRAYLLKAYYECRRVVVSGVEPKPGK
jgi:hypothetical protein